MFFCSLLNYHQLLFASSPTVDVVDDDDALADH